MPHLILNFETSHEEVEQIDHNGQLRREPTGRQFLELRMMDTEQGKVSEIWAEITKMKQDVRPPHFGEMDIGSKALGKGVGEKISKIEYDRLKTEMETYRGKATSAEEVQRRSQKLIDDLNSKLDGLYEQNKQLKKEKLNNDKKNLLGAALDHYIEYHLLPSQQYKTYESAKRLYKSLTGRSWVDGSEDDDEEEASCGCVGNCGCPAPPHPADQWAKNSDSEPIPEIKKLIGFYDEEINKLREGGRKNRGFKWYDNLMYGDLYFEKKYVPEEKIEKDEIIGLDFGKDMQIHFIDGWNIDVPLNPEKKQKPKKKSKKTMSDLQIVQEQQRFARQGPQQKKRAPRNL